MTKKITIVGGGYGGTMLARELDPYAEVALIEPRDKWVHNVAMIRGLAKPELIDQAIFPYDKLLRRGTIVRDRVTAINGSDAILRSGDVVSGDVLIVATGSSYAAPFKMQGEDSEDFLKTIRRAAEQVDKAKNIVIVGGGAVGVELAGEVSSARPEKSITLVTAEDRLFPDYRGGMGRRLERQLAELGVKLRLGERIKKLDRSDAPYVPKKGTVLLADGFPIDADLVIPAIGTRPENELMKSLEGVEFDELGRVKTDGWLRPAGKKDLFVIGDIASTGDTMTIVGLTRQVGWLKKALKGYLRGRAIEKAKPYTPWPKPVILVPLGEDKGASALPGFVAGPPLTSMIKGKKLFLPRYVKEFGYRPGS